MITPARSPKTKNCHINDVVNSIKQYSRRFTKKQQHEFVRHELDHHYICVFSYERKVQLNCQRNQFGCNSHATSDKRSIQTHAQRSHMDVCRTMYAVGGSSETHSLVEM